VNGPFGFNNTTSRFGLHAGAGLKIMLDKSFSIDGTYRYIRLETVKSKDLSAHRQRFRDNGSAGFYVLSIDSVRGFRKYGAGQTEFRLAVGHADVRPGKCRVPGLAAGDMG